MGSCIRNAQSCWAKSLTTTSTDPFMFTLGIAGLTILLSISLLEGNLITAYHQQEVIAAIDAKTLQVQPYFKKGEYEFRTQSSITNIEVIFQQTITNVMAGDSVVLNLREIKEVEAWLKATRQQNFALLKT